MVLGMGEARRSRKAHAGLCLFDSDGNLMRNLIYLSWLLISLALAIPSMAQSNTITLTYNVTDYSLNAASVKSVQLTPLTRGADYQGSPLARVPIKPMVFTNGTAIFTNIVTGYAYQFGMTTIYGTQYRTNYFEQSLSGEVNGFNREAWIIGFSETGGVLQWVWIAGTNNNGTVQTNISYTAVTNLTSFGAITNNDTRQVTFTDRLTVGSGATDGRIILTDGESKNYAAIVGDSGWQFGQPIEANGSLLTALNGSAISSGTVADARIASTIARDSEVTQATNDVVSGLAAGAYSINGMLVDGDAGLYLSAVGKTNSQFANRIDGGFKELKSTGLWTNMIDGAVLGSTLNLSGSYWRTFRLNYGTNINNPTTLDYGIQFHGTNRAYVRNIADMRTNTLLVCYQSVGNFDISTSTNAIIAAQNASSSNGSVAVFSYPYIASPLWDAPALKHYIGGNIAVGQAVSNSFPAFTSASISARNMQEHYLSIGVSGVSRAASIDGLSASLSDMTFSITNSLTSLNLAAFTAGDSGTNTTGMFIGTIKSFIVFDRLLSSNEVKQAIRAIRWFDVRETSYIFVGDSLTQAYDDPHETGTGSTNNWPWQFMNNPANSNRYFYRNWARGGLSASSLTAAEYTNRHQLFAPGGAVKESKMIYWLGANDILQSPGDADPTGAINAAKNIWALANRDGFTVEVINIMTMTNSFGGQVTNNALRLSYNRALETNAGFYTKLWHVEEMFPYRNTNSLYSGDGTHGTYALHRAIADYMTGGEMTSTGALYRTRGTVAADAFIGDGLMLTNTTLAGISEDIVYLRDDFFSGVSSSANGDLNWSTAGVATYRNMVYDRNRWGALSAESSATANTAGMRYLGASGSAYHGVMPVDSVVPWRMKWIVRLYNTNSVGHIFGLIEPSSTWSSASQGYFAQYDDTLTGSNWNLVTRDGSGAVTNSTGVQATTNWVKLEMRSDVVGQIALRVNGGTWVTNSSNTPTNASPFQAIIPRENVAKTNAVDFFEFVAWPDR
jgi:lysophospholipase L1-like esterase